MRDIPDILIYASSHCYYCSVIVFYIVMELVKYYFEFYM